MGALARLPLFVLGLAFVACKSAEEQPPVEGPPEALEATAAAPDDEWDAWSEHQAMWRSSTKLTEQVRLTADGRYFIKFGLFIQPARAEIALRETCEMPPATTRYVFEAPPPWFVPRGMVEVDWQGGEGEPGASTPARTITWYQEYETQQGRALVHMPFGRIPFPGEAPATRPETILILATIHGDEHAGTPLVQMLATVLDTDHSLTRDRHVVLVPVANPDGYAANTRGNASGVDLNRNFDAANWGTSKRAQGGVEPLSEHESNFLVALFEEYQPDRVVSLHQPLGLVDFDGPGEAYARAVAAAGNLPVEQLGSRPGSFGSYVGVDHQIPILTIELPAGAQRWSDAKLWERFGPLMVAAVTWSPEG